MNGLKTTVVKREAKQEREKRVLLGLVEHYLLTGKPVGSNTLKEVGFEDLSSATIRNYFAKLEEEGLLTQQHSSGGRVPTDLAFRTYAKEYIDHPLFLPKEEPALEALRLSETREIASFLHYAAEELSNLSRCAVFMSSPRFDQDFITAVRLVSLDVYRCLCIFVTDFGVVQTEILHVEKKLSAFSIKRIEDYLQARLANLPFPENLEEEEEKLAKKIYNELMVRYLVGYSNFTDETIYKTGLSKLLDYPEYQDIKSLTIGMSLFENPHRMRLLLRESAKLQDLKFWIGDDLTSDQDLASNCTVIAVPYRINSQTVGAAAILGPPRIPYRRLFGLLRSFSASISEALTRNLFKFKISYRQPQKGALYLQQGQHLLLEDGSSLKLIEDKRKEP